MLSFSYILQLCETQILVDVLLCDRTCFKHLFHADYSGFASVCLTNFFIHRHIYSQEQKSINIFADDSSSAVNPSYIRSWLDLLSTTPRVAPFLSKNDPLIKALEKVASVTFDLLLLLVLGSYLITLFSFLFITPRGLDDLISLFRHPPSRKVKTA
ncbi:uncharacterized protein LOC132032574 isoform X1 [Lycium ferocissimum]|uniref:uncharacterized protein LOC132032574 isoform X1 n=1 Tax=Lycium ferocissimum TaxID=112874 RepID=UPI00281603B3|nr:uncharacterized protein LOC132032574 isoform X1 [Lycium ferocissimum]